MSVKSAAPRGAQSRRGAAAKAAAGDTRGIKRRGPHSPAAEPAEATLETPRRRLPRGSGSLPQALIGEIQRQRLLDAVTVVVASKGFAAASVADVIEHAGVSRKTFYEHFADKHACYVAAFDRAATKQLRVVEKAFGAGGDSHEQLSRALFTHINALARDPMSSKAFLDEALRSCGSSESADQHWQDFIARYRSLLRKWWQRARVEWPEVGAPSDTLLNMAIGGINTNLATLIRSDNMQVQRQLPQMLSFLYGAMGFHELARRALQR